MLSSIAGSYVNETDFTRISQGTILRDFKYLMPEVTETEAKLEEYVFPW